MMYEMYLIHHGIKGQKWGVKNGPPYPLEQHSAGKLTGAEDPKGLSSWMKKNISYAEYTTLKSPEETVKRGKGSCHDQVLLELEELRSMGYSPKATFFIEYSPKSSQGGTTHAFVTYEEKGKTYWLENAWGGQEGLHEFNNLDEIKGYITKLHKSGKTGDNVRFPNLEFSDFGEHKPGESLQELVDKSLSTEDEKKKLKHSEEGSEMPTKYVELSDYLAHHGILGMKWGVRIYTKPDSSVFSTKIKASDKLKVASEKSARKVLSDLVKNDPSYADDLADHIFSSAGRYGRAEQNKLMEKAFRSIDKGKLDKGKIDRSIYEALNLSLTDHGLSTTDRVSKGFYKALKEHGYDAIMDVNDRKYSGYMTSKPVIVFGGNKKLSISGREKLSVDEIEQDLAKAGDVMQKQIRGVLAKAGAVSVSLLSAPPAAVIGARSAQKYTQKHNEIVSEYIKAHPATKLTYDEILANYYGHK